MKKYIYILLLFSLIVFFPVPGKTNSPALYPQAAGNPAYIRHELLVKYKPGTHRKTASALKDNLGASTIRRFRSIDSEHISLPEGMSVQDALEIFQNDPNVEWAKPNYIRRAMAISPPDDSFFTKQWPLQNTGQTVNNTSGTENADIQALDAWETTTDCSNIIIAIIDSGVDLNHPDIKNNLWTNSDEIAGNGIDDDNNGFIDDIHGWNFTDNNNDVSDSNDHGTHVAGVIAAQGNNATGTTGICWSAKLMILKFLDTSGTGSTTDEISAIEYAVANNAKIINASFGESGYLKPELNAILAADSADILFIAASGNQGFDNDTQSQEDKIYPGGYDLSNIIAVAASDQNDQLPDWSVYGATTVDLAAPGTDILAPFPNRETVWSSSFDTSADGWSLTGSWARIVTSPSYLTDSPSADYNSNTETTATSPLIDLSGKGATILTFKIRGSAESNDMLYLETATSLDGTWTNQMIEIESLSGGNTHYEAGMSGTFFSWKDAAVMLTNIDDTEAAYIRFRFSTNDSDEDDGWDIDDLTIQAVDMDYPDPATDHYQYLSGTSAATPIVAGAAGILWSHTSGLSNSQIKNSLINGVDQLPAFQGKVVSGGRLNLSNSLQLSLSETVTVRTAVTGGDSSTCFIKSLFH
jgi:subtilisin family serine protease